jgi:hypothetical protein
MEMTILPWFLTITLLLSLGAANAATSNSMNVPITITAASGLGNEIFVGPFANWLNVKTTPGCGATGNGSTDDTAAIQNCINKLSSTTPVLYFPAGTYKITSALSVPSQNFISLIGAAPSLGTAGNPPCNNGLAEAGKVCIVWGGPANSATMLQLHDVSFSRVDRLTFNGNNGVASLILDSPASTSSIDEFTDDVFIGAGGTYNGGTSIDFACGWVAGVSAFTGGSNGCSEIAFVRDKFVGGTWGIAGGNGNAGDMWVWYSTFSNLGIALQNKLGDIQAFYNNFSGSLTADISVNPQGEQTFDWNYSFGSNQFITCDYWYNTATVTVAEGNTIVNTRSPQAINCNTNQGPMILIDNAIYSGADATTPVIKMATQATGGVGDLFTTGNTFSTISGGTVNDCRNTVSTNYVQSATSAGSRCHSLGDQTTSVSPPAAPTLPETPPQYCASGCPNTITVYEETTARTTAEIQADINSAAAANNGSVVHLQAGNYSLGATLSVPGNSFLQIIGDGNNTTITGPNPVYSCGSACKASFRDFEINGNGYTAVGIKLTGSDQVGGRIFMDQFEDSDNASGLLVNGLFNTNVEIHNSNFGDDGHYSGGTGYAINVAGGSGPSSSYTNVFAGGFYCTTGAAIKTSGNANFTLRHMWHDAGSCSLTNWNVARVGGTGNFAMAGARTYLWGTPGHYFDIEGFSGNSALIGIWTNEGYSPADEYINPGGAVGQNLQLGYVGCSSTNPSFTDTSANDKYDLLNVQINGPAGCNNQLGYANSHSAYAAESSQNVADHLAFINNTLAPLRAALPTLPGASGDPALASGVTDTRIYRVLGTKCSTAIDVEP